jgi:arylsulfatase A-like enzyme
MTGRYNWRTKLQSGVLNGYSEPLIAKGRLTVPGLLKQKGYRTGCVGKWHLGMGIDKDQTSPVISDGPTTRGFDYYFGISASLDMPPFAFIENDRFTEPLTAKKKWLREGPAGERFEAIDVLPTLTKKAIEFIQQSAKSNQSYFLYLPLASPHTPIVPSEAWQGKSKVGAYGDFVMETDWALGEVLSAIDASGAGRNTLVIMTSDNGCSKAAGIQELQSLGHYPSGDLRGSKADIFDGGHRVPFIVRWPDRIQAGTASDQTICHTDLIATCAELIGVTLPDDAGEDSVSILPALLGQDKAPLHEAVVHHSINGSFAIRQGKWKLELCASSGGWSDPKPGSADAKQLPSVQLYDLQSDLAESQNVQAKYPDEVQRLTKLLERFIDEGRSTPGARQPNDSKIEVRKKADTRSGE